MTQSKLSRLPGCPECVRGRASWRRYWEPAPGLRQSVVSDHWNTVRAWCQAGGGHLPLKNVHDPEKPHHRHTLASANKSPVPRSPRTTLLTPSHGFLNSSTPLPSLRTKSHIKGGVPGLPGWRQCLIKGVGRLFHLKALVFLQEIRGWHCWLQPRTLRSHKGPERPWLCVSATTGNKTGALPSSFTNNVQMPN